MFAGIHISGPNAPKTSFVGLRGRFSTQNLEVFCLYDKIGATARAQSDDRLMEIIQREGPFAEVFVDCPLSVPSCVSCQRAACPGVVACEEVSVAYLLSLSSKFKREKKFFNPQTLRLWDGLYWQQRETRKVEPTYSPNMAPLVTRARTLQKRLNSVGSAISLKETSVAFALSEIDKIFEISDQLGRDYRNFEVGRKRREQVLRAMVQKKWIKPLNFGPDDMRLAANLENFQAFIAAFVAALTFDGLVTTRPSNYALEEGWVHTPILE